MEETTEQPIRRRAGRPRVGRLRAEDFKTVSLWLDEADREYLALFNENNTLAVRELIERARKMWPKG